jgi:hypothetical protein
VRTGDVLGEKAPVANPAELVVSCMEHEGRHVQAGEESEGALPPTRYPM